MKFTPITPPRAFKVGHQGREIELLHVLDLELGQDEQVTLKTESGGEFDVCRKSWGYYATPSLNGRLTTFGYRSCLVNSGSRRYVQIVETERMDEYLDYVADQGMEIVAWLDSDEIEWLTKS
ncbi:hypothetical protein N9F34_02435 [Alphaproteobacteria bacterium]|nr:hypothetical protein [Alphaproteobacteria bacterium]